MSYVLDEDKELSDDDYPRLPRLKKIRFNVSVFTDDIRDTWGWVPQAVLQDSDPEYDSDPPMARRSRTYKQMQIQRKLAFCMLLHDRLGAKSFWRNLREVYTRKIIELM